MNTELEQKVIQGLEAHLNNWDTKDAEEWLTGCAACPYNTLPRNTANDSCVCILMRDALMVAIIAKRDKERASVSQ